MDFEKILRILRTAINMKTSPVQDRLQYGNYIEEKISIDVYNSSEILKNEIRKVIIRYRMTGWQLSKLYNSGPFIFLRFGQTS